MLLLWFCFQASIVGRKKKESLRRKIATPLAEILNCIAMKMKLPKTFLRIENLRLKYMCMNWKMCIVGKCARMRYRNALKMHNVEIIEKKKRNFKTV